ncbi:hypothetical protein [Paractinoplanes rishiriensis]|uniref:DivIVA domain-containing protein n=1 Tax=Paractinoplanes rishiriensis TaxID=1050105 RepID=A0A919K5G6_9ACTN|nr:hypothetical protein [Actinoplanes rishiriensis]GIF00514.1 hypothetical protein Ari01nite_79780 [Actinoplanes rishiriensis]
MAFTVVLRGYDRAQVDGLLARADEALAGDSEFQRAAARDALRDTRPAVTFRGYDRQEVDGAIAQRRHLLDGGSVAAMPFTIVLRGYFRTEVDDLMARAAAALESDDPAERAAARDALSNPEFGYSLRGYDEHQVDRAIEQLRNQLSDQ